PAPARQTYSRSVMSCNLPNVTLIDAGGAKVSLISELSDARPVLLQFIFTTCPTICPVMSATFSAAQARFATVLQPVRMISISIDPEHDTPARLRAYARKFKA